MSDFKPTVSPDYSRSLGPRVTITVPADLGPSAREAIAIELRNAMQERANNGLGVSASGNRSKRFAPYTEAYADFKAARGQSTSPPNLILDGDMLADFNVIRTKKGEVTIGFKRGSDQKDKAHGNITGSYGQPSGNKSRARNFIGLPTKVIQDIIKQNS